jgi:tRNA pseudouridine38/39 synthase
MKVALVHMGKKIKEKGGFNFAVHGTRQIALQISYVGWDFKGFASQETTEETIEGHLFNALTKTCLIQSRGTAHYSRCARTDKGVSALGQVVSVRVRSNLQEGLGVFAAVGMQQQGQEPPADVAGGDDAPDDDAEELPGREFWVNRPEQEPHPGCSAEDRARELPYLQMLNSVLPPTIRAIAWCPVIPEFNARFACQSRSYKYFFVKGDLDIARHPPHPPFPPPPKPQPPYPRASILAPARICPHPFESVRACP